MPLVRFVQGLGLDSLKLERERDSGREIEL
jgi:hypothetical protein